MTEPVYRVVWLHAVRGVWLGQLLLELRARGESSDPVFAAMDRITAALTARPEDAGESRGEGYRFYFDPPVSVTYEVHPDDRLVVIFKATHVRRAGKPDS